MIARMRSLLIIFAITLAIIGLLIFSRGKPEQKPQFERSFFVAAQSLKRQDFTPNIILYGRVETPFTSKITAAIEADVVATPALEGAFVKKGELILALDDRDATLLVRQREAEVDELKARLATQISQHKADKAALIHELELQTISERSLQRQMTLSEQLVGSEQSTDQAREALRQQNLSIVSRQLAIEDHDNQIAQLEALLAKANALLEQAKLDLERTQLRAPFNGRIARLRVAVGQRVREGDQLIDIFDNERIEIRAQIPSQHIAAVQKAMLSQEILTGSAYLDEQTFDVILERLAGEVIAGRGGVDALFKVNADTTQLALGRALEVTLSLPTQKNIFAVPNSSLYQQNIIYKIIDNRLQGVNVMRLGQITDPQSGDFLVLIDSDELNDDDVILTTALPQARTGLKVDIR